MIAGGAVESRIEGLVRWMVPRKITRLVIPGLNVPSIVSERPTPIGASMLWFAVGMVPMLALIYCIILAVTVLDDLWYARLPIFGDARQFWPRPIAMSGFREARRVDLGEHLGHHRSKERMWRVDEQRLARARVELERRDVHYEELATQENPEDRPLVADEAPEMPRPDASQPSAADHEIPVEPRSMVADPGAGIRQDSGEVDLPGTEGNLDARRLRRLLAGLRHGSGASSFEVGGQEGGNEMNGMSWRQNPHLEKEDGLDCCDPNGSELPSCHDPDCAYLVCFEGEALDCCIERWDAGCAELAQGLCDICADEPY